VAGVLRFSSRLRVPGHPLSDRAAMRAWWLVAPVCLALGASPAATGSAATARTTSAPAASTATSVPTATDWPQFGYSNQRPNTGPASTGITAAIELNDIRVNGRTRNVIVLSTSYGRTLALAAGDGAQLWEYSPSDIGTFAGSAYFTSASPTADPDHRCVYARPTGQTACWSCLPTG
jgi:hypothetical protein